MGGIYDSILKAYGELKEKSGQEPKSIDLGNVSETVSVSAFFRKNGEACEIRVSAKPGVKLHRAVSTYGGKRLHYGANHEVVAGRDLYGIRLRQGLFMDTIEAEFPEKIDAKDAKALVKTFELLKIPYKSDGKSLSVGTWRLHRKVKAEDCEKAFDVISGSGTKYPYVSSTGNDSSVYASNRGVFVTLELGRNESETKRKKRMDELQAFLGCGILDGLDVRFYSFGKEEDAPGKKYGRSTTIA